MISSVPRQTASAFLAQYENDLLLNLERGIPSESELTERYDNTVVPLMRTSRVYGFPQRWRYVAQSAVPGACPPTDAVHGRVGARHIKVGPGMRGEPVEPEAMRENWSALCEEASGYGVWLALESQPYSYFPTVESTIQLVSEVDHPAGGILVDIWHAYRSGLDYGEMVALIPKRYLYAVELADTKAEVVGTLFEDTINNRELCGEGDADVEAFIRAIDRIGYDGPWGVEIISHAHRARPIGEALTRAFDTAAASFRSARG